MGPIEHDKKNREEKAMEKLHISKKEVQMIMERDNLPIHMATVKAVEPYSKIFFGKVVSRRRVMDEFIYPYVKIVE